MSLYTWKRLNSYKWYNLSIINEGIIRVEALAEDKKKPLMVDRHVSMDKAISCLSSGANKKILASEFKVVVTGFDFRLYFEVF